MECAAFAGRRCHQHKLDAALGHINKLIQTMPKIALDQEIAQMTEENANKARAKNRKIVDKVIEGILEHSEDIAEAGVELGLLKANPL